MVTNSIENEALVVDSRGAVHYPGLGANKVGEKNIRINGEVQLSSHFQGLKNIHGTIYIVGNLRQVVRHDGIEAWSDISEPIQVEAKKRYLDSFKSGSDVYETGFNCIDGFEVNKDIYAAGDSSDAWKYTGQSWTPIDIDIFGEDMVLFILKQDKVDS